MRSKHSVHSSKKVKNEMFKIVVIQLAILNIAILLDVAEGHGMMLDPPGRSSRWRYNDSAPQNHNDNGYYCGGYNVQWNIHGGKCGICGDNYGNPVPRDNELGGKYGGSGVIVKTYENAYTIDVGVQITANHLGYISFDLCNLDEFKNESEECFSKYPLKFADGSDKFYIGTTNGWIDSTIVLPSHSNCKHCVLRWTYTAGNNWGICEDGKGATGCGPQETFKSCADISIKSAPTRSNLLSVPVKQVPELENKFKVEVPIVVEQ